MFQQCFWTILFPRSFKNPRSLLLLMSVFPVFPSSLGGRLVHIFFVVRAGGPPPCFTTLEKLICLEKLSWGSSGSFNFSKAEVIVNFKPQKKFLHWSGKLVWNRRGLASWLAYNIHIHIRDMAWWCCCCGLTEQKIKNLPHEVTWQLFNQSRGRPSLKEPINVLEKTTHAKLDWKEE